MSSGTALPCLTEDDEISGENEKGNASERHLYATLVLPLLRSDYHL